MKSSSRLARRINLTNLISRQIGLILQDRIDTRKLSDGINSPDRIEPTTAWPDTDRESR